MMQDLIQNWEQTTVSYVPISNWMMAKEELKKIPITGIGDKHQIIFILAANITSKLLPLQLVFLRENYSTFTNCDHCV